MFLGIADSVSDLKGDNATESHTLFHIDEAFLGLPSTQKQVVVNFQGDWIERGKSYLIDGQRDEKGEVHPAICGASGEAEERYTSA